MGKVLKSFLFVILPVFLYSCATVYKGDDFTTPKDEILPPGEIYTPERDKCLNVVYYVPSDTVAWANWHYRLSGITLHIQEYFEENLKRHHVNDNFGLVVNENPEYVKIHYIKSTRMSIDMGKKDIGAMKSEILGYFDQHPEERLSDNFLVFMPQYEGSFIGNTVSVDDGMGMAFCGCDDDRFNMKFFISPRGRALYLTELGEILHNLGLSFFLPLEDHGTFDSYLHLMGMYMYKPSGLSAYTIAYNYPVYSGTFNGSTFTAGVPDKIRLSAASANILGTLPLFRNKDGMELLNVEISKTEIASFEGDYYTGENFSADSLFVTCRFRTDKPIAGVIMYHDPWIARDFTSVPAKNMQEWDEDPFNDTGNDAYATWLGIYDINTDPGTGEYVACFRISMGDLKMNRPVGAKAADETYSEIRFRFIGENGEMYPRYPDIKGGDHIVRETVDANGKEIPGIQYGVRYIYGLKGIEAAAEKTIAHDIQKRYGSRVPVEID